MSIELAIAIGIVLGLAVGLLIDRNARKERDERIRQLEKELEKKGYDADSNDN